MNMERDNNRRMDDIMNELRDIKNELRDIKDKLSQSQEGAEGT